MKTYLSDEVFELLYGYLQHERAIYIGNREGVRLFLEGIYWLARSGSQWRFLPEEYGYWNTVYRRFQRWSDKGVWRRMFHHFSQDSDMEWLMIDSTIVRAHACAAGGKGGPRFRHWDGVREAIAAKYI